MIRARLDCLFQQVERPLTQSCSACNPLIAYRLYQLTRLVSIKTCMVCGRYRKKTKIRKKKYVFVRARVCMRAVGGCLLVVERHAIQLGQ